MTGTELPNGNIVLTTSYGTCFEPWSGDEDDWVDSFPCTGDETQEWVAIPVGGSFMYQNASTGYCLDLTRSGTDYATQNVCNPNDSGQILTLG